MSLNDRIALKLGAEILARLVAEERVEQVEAELAEARDSEAPPERAEDLGAP